MNEVPTCLCCFTFIKERNWSHSVMSHSLPPHGLLPTRLLCPWDFPDKNTGVGCHFILQLLLKSTKISTNVWIDKWMWELHLSIATTCWYRTRVWQNSMKTFSDNQLDVWNLQLSMLCILSRVNCVLHILSVQFSSVAQSCLTLRDPMDRSTSGLPVHPKLPEFTQTHAHWVSDAIQPSHPLSSPSPPALNPSQHQGLFKWVSSPHQVAKVSEFQLELNKLKWTPL